MADEREALEAMALAELKRGREEVVEGGSKRLRHASELDEPLLPVAAATAASSAIPNGVSHGEQASLGFKDEEGAEVVDASRSGSGSGSLEEAVVEDEGIYSDVEEAFAEGEETDDSEDGGVQYSDEDEDDEEGDDDDDEDSDGELHLPPPPVDRKCKGIVIDNGKGKGKSVAVHDYKGKGKAIVEEDSSDDSDAGVENDDFFSRGMMDDELHEDPLEEVDLNNILPTRTRCQRLQKNSSSAAHHFDDPSDEEDEDYVANNHGN